MREMYCLKEKNIKIKNYWDKFFKMAQMDFLALSLPWIRGIVLFIYVNIAQIGDEILVYLCNLTFLKKV